MRKLIKSIREYLGLSQTEFADKIGVTFATVNRWENGRAIPTKLAQTTLYEYCKEHGVPHSQLYCAISLFCQFACFESNLAAVGKRDGLFNRIHI